MPENRVMYLGIVLIVAAVSLWLGAELTKRIEWTVPYVGGAGVVLVVLAWRSNSRRRGKPLHASASNAHDEAGHLRHAHIRPRGMAAANARYAHDLTFSSHRCPARRLRWLSGTRRCARSSTIALTPRRSRLCRPVGRD